MDSFLNKLKEYICYTGKGYRVGVPWKKDKPQLSENRHTALTRLCGTENKLKKDCALGAEYLQIIHSYVQKGTCERLSRGNHPHQRFGICPIFP